MADAEYISRLYEAIEYTIAWLRNTPEASVFDIVILDAVNEHYTAVASALSRY